MTRQKEQEDQAEKNENERGDRKGESIDSSEIPNRHPRPPFGD